MKVYGDEALAVLNGVGFGADGSECGDYVHARGWKIDAEGGVRDGRAATRVLLIDRNGDVVGEGWGDAADHALAAAFADYLGST